MALPAGRRISFDIQQSLGAGRQSCIMVRDTLSTAYPPEPVLDEAELARVTFGDEALAGELLALFSDQAAMLMGRIGEAVAATAQREDVHRLCGAARAVALRRVDHAATMLEERLVRRLASGGVDALPPDDGDVAALAQAVGEACRAIALREAARG